MMLLDGMLCLRFPSAARWTVLAVDNESRTVIFSFTEVNFRWRRNAQRWINRATPLHRSHYEIAAAAPWEVLR